MHQAQAAQTARASAEASQVREHDLRGVTDDHVLDRTAAIDQHADLAMQLGALQRELAGELDGDHLGRRDTAAIQTLEGFDLARLEPAQVPGDLFLHPKLSVATGITMDIVTA